MTETSSAPPLSASSIDTSAGNTYVIRPNYKQKFRTAQVTKLIHQVLVDKLTGATYHPDTCSQWSKDIADEIKKKLKGETDSESSDLARLQLKLGHRKSIFRTRSSAIQVRRQCCYWRNEGRRCKNELSLLLGCGYRQRCSRYFY